MKRYKETQKETLLNMSSKPSNAAYIAVFGDIHGRIALMYVLARLWQEHTGQPLAAILQVGDMGAYPDHGKLDRATLRHAQRDPDELDFVRYIEPSEDGERFVNVPEAPRTYFIRGNHEDFDYLGQFRSPSPIDPWEQIWFIPDGHSVDVPLYPESEWTGEQPDAGMTHLRVGAFGGVEPKDVERCRGRAARKAYPKNKQHVRRPKYFDPDTIPTAFHNEPPLDILLTHAGPDVDELRSGSTCLSRLCQRIQPWYHFFGHHHVVLGPKDGPGGTSLVGLDHLDFNAQGKLADNAWGILRYSAESTSFTFCNTEIYPWLHHVRRETYRNLLPE